MIQLDFIFTDHIVLQHGKPVILTGSVSPLKEVIAELDGERYSAVAGPDGRFSVALGIHPAGGPHTITVKAGAEETLSAACGGKAVHCTDPDSGGECDLRKLCDVCFGDVWVAGGQSNMELRLEDCDEAEIGEETKKNAGELCGSGEQKQFSEMDFLSGIRYVNTAKDASRKWICCDEESRLKMSAAAYYFACEVRQKTGHAVGIIESCIGGTSVASWISKETLNTSGAGRACIDEFRKQTEGVTEEQFRTDFAAFKKKADAWNSDTKTYRKEHPEKNWTEILKIYGTAPWPEPVWQDSPFCPGIPFETMIRPVTVCPVKGFLYYQGEADAYNYRNYPELMRMLITEWRKAWHDETLPFLFVQLPMFRFSASPADDNWPNQRLAQELVSKTVPGARMAVLTDQGELDNIHPAAKRPVGERLARLALRYVYGYDVEADAPEKDKIIYEKDAIWVTFKNTGGALVCDGEKVKAFEISRDGVTFYPAEGRVDGNSVILSCGKGCGPDVASRKDGGLEYIVRYAWAGFCETNLFGANGLPAKTFHTGIPV